MRLFDPNLIDFAKVGPAVQDESDYVYLSTSSRDVCQQVREFLEELFASYPDEHKKEMKRRIETSQTDFTDDFFELALYSWLKRIGSEVEVHPEVSPDVLKRPDFLVKLPSGYEFYLEAVVATGMSDADRAREMVVNSIYSHIDRKLKSPRFFISVCVRHQGANQPSARKLVHALYQYLEGLDHEEAKLKFDEEGLDREHRFTWEQDGWVIEFTPIPKTNNIGHPDHRPIAAHMMPEVVVCEDIVEIRDSVKFKIKHHGNLDKPYVIAVNATKWSAGHDDIHEALYGTEHFAVRAFADGTFDMAPGRSKDGIWLGDAGLKNQHVVGIIGATKLTPWTIVRSEIKAYPNPYIEAPECLEALQIPRLVVNGNKLDTIDPGGLQQIFGLPDEWPREEEG